MAEEKNNFINCKMNRDIDDRLIPNGQYREAINLQISRSEGANVGALQNVLGNESVVDFNILAEVDGLQSIGVYVDDNNNDIYVFLTDYTNPPGTEVYNEQANNYIYSYNTITGSVIKLVEGEWLNFSTTSPIYGINLLENLLFWTDNRNQPRKINVVSASQNPGYYSSDYDTGEAQISVAKLNPYQPITLYKESEVAIGEYETTMYDVISEFLPSSNPGTALVNGTTLLTTFVTVDTFTPTQFYPSAGQVVSGVGVTIGTKVVSFDIVTNIVEVDIPQIFTNDTVLSFSANPYYDPNYGGDPTFLEDKFVRFSYRFRFDDGEYSLIAPFTQPAFIPKQDGYFQYLGYYDADQPGVDDETNTYQSTIVNFMKNKVNNIMLQIPLPCTAENVFNAYKIIELDILYKESDGLTIQVVDTIPVETVMASTIPGIYEYNYESKKPYKTLPQSEITRVYDKVPIRALSQEVISNRIVYGNYQDKFSYPKYLDYTIGWKEKEIFSLDVNPSYNKTSYIEYPNHSVKQNRTYQVGLVLSDQFGRTSGVILSNNIVNNSIFGASTVTIPYSVDNGSYNPLTFPGLALNIQFNEPILLVSPDQTMGFPGLYNGNSKDPLYNPLGWVSYKIVVKQTQQDYYNVYLPGVMAGYPRANSINIDTIAHTVLINDNINKVPRDLKEIGPTQVQFRSSVTLYPRVNNIETSPLPPNPSSPLPPQDPRSPIGNVQYYPGNTKAFVNTISTLNALFNPTTAITIADHEWQFYDANSNPLIARLSTTNELGVVADFELTRQGVQYLAVYETKPTESRLDIYWETTTAGKIDELNEAILDGECGTFSIVNWNYIQDEAFDIGQSVVGPFYPQTSLNNPIVTSSITMFVEALTVVGGSADRTNDFTLVRYPAGTPLPDTSVLPYDCYFINTASYFYYGVGADFSESFRFTLNVTSDCISTGLPITSTFVAQGNLINVAPTIVCPTEIIFINEQIIPVYQFEGVNGSNSGQGIQTQDLAWSVKSQENALTLETVDLFSFNLPVGPLIPTTPGLLKCKNPEIAFGVYNITVELRDVQGGVGYSYATCDIVVQYPGIPLFYQYNNCNNIPGDYGLNGPTFDNLANCNAAAFNCKQFQYSKIGAAPQTMIWQNCSGVIQSTTVTNNNTNILCGYNILLQSPYSIGSVFNWSATGNIGQCG